MNSSKPTKPAPVVVPGAAPRKRRYPKEVTPERAAELAAQRAAVRALNRLIGLATKAQRGDDQAAAVARFLLALEDGHHYPLDVAMLRRLTPRNGEDCLTILAFDMGSVLPAWHYVPESAAIKASLIERWGLNIEQYVRAEVMLQVLPKPFAGQPTSAADSQPNNPPGAGQ